LVGNREDPYEIRVFPENIDAYIIPKNSIEIMQGSN
jgi:hypothetical protein